MEKIVYILICHFGLEKVLKAEIRKLGLEITEVNDGEVKAIGTIVDLPRLNYMLRTAERVMIEIGSFEAKTFEELYEKTKLLPISKYVPVDGIFLITKANQDKNSILHSSMSIQSIVKKAMVDNLKESYNTDTLVEQKGRYPFRVKFNKNIASIRLDTTGDSLHKRGYRIKSGLAPIEETLAAAIVKLCEFRYDSILIDPFCGSGTILIEAAMIALNMQATIDRAFVSEMWQSKICTEKYREYWKEALIEAKDKLVLDRKKLKNKMLFGFDIDPHMIEIAKENAERAGVAELIHFEAVDIKKLPENNTIKNIYSDNYTHELKSFFANMKKNRNQSVGNTSGADIRETSEVCKEVNIKKMIITNPPYGERLEDKEKVAPLYKYLKEFRDKCKDTEMHVITSFEDATKYLGKETKNRKIYNGMLKTYLYQYL